MSSTITRLSAALADRYVIERELGAGGMATVYLAHDVRHDRKVALKVLRPELSAILGAGRFLAEIKTTANLQHPHILSLFDSGEADGTVFYVMPYVEGESLRDRLTREKQLPVEEAVRIAREVADALDYAHAHGVVHRDIKPENILLHGGHAQVADFGIALAASRSDTGSRMTETGMSLGTPHYMSPEQAMGEREITAKSDVYALGCVLYEMLLGEPPFTGPTAQSIVAKVMTEVPRPITIHRRSVPPHVEGAVLGALEKLPADRFSSAAEFAAALADSGTTARRLVAASDAGGRGSALRYSRGRVLAAGLALLAAGGAIGWAATRRPALDQPVGRFVISTGADAPLAAGFGGTNVALSADGQTLVFRARTGSGQLYLRRMGDLVPTLLREASTDLSGIAIAPDGRSVIASSSRGVQRLPVDGGTPTTVTVQGFSALTWISWFAARPMVTPLSSGVLAWLNEDGSLETVARPDTARGERALYAFGQLPGGRLMVIVTSQPNPSGPLLAIDPRDGRRDTILPAAVVWAGYDHGALAWVVPDGTLLAARFDAGRAALTSAPVTLARNIQIAVGWPPQVTMSRAGSIVYVPSQSLDLVVVDRSGRYRDVAGVQHRYHSPRFSPDGRSVAVDFTHQSSRDVWRLELRDSTLRRVTFEADGHDPVWLPGGDQILFASGRRGIVGIWRRNADGSGEAESVLTQAGGITALAVARDGGIIAQTSAGNASWDIVAVPAVGDRRPRVLHGSPFDEWYPALSPDGRWLAYVTSESGRYEVYVRPYPGPGASTLVSQQGGSEPVWSRRGDELFYRAETDAGPQLIAARLQPGTVARVVSRTPLFATTDYEAAAPHANYDVSADGQFLMVRMGRQSEMVLLQTWTGLLRDAAPAAR